MMDAGRVADALESRSRQVVAEGAGVRGVIDGSCTPSGVRMLWNCNPGWSSLSLLDPGLISVIPAGIKKAARPPEINQSD